MAENKENKIDFGNEQSKRSTKGLVMDILDGSILNKSGLIQHLSYIFFLGMLGIIYIGNRYHAENLIKETKRAEKTLYDTHYEAVSVSSNLVLKQNQSNILKLLKIKGIEIKPSLIPPKKLYIDD
ncbi:MAG: FtsL-like putative cell division protein [Bacteroidota bacterium]|nr:FtsL-like putative cell division protein [Bacteroidota bacterium]